MAILQTTKAETVDTLIALGVLPIVFFLGPLATYAVWIHRWKEFEEFEDMHGIAATAFATAAIFLFYYSHNAPDKFARSPEMLIVAAAISLEVVYDRIALYLHACRHKTGPVSKASQALGLIAAVVCILAGYFVYVDIGHEIAIVAAEKKPEEVSSSVSVLWIASFLLAFCNKYWQGRVRVRAKRAAEAAAAKAVEAAKVDCLEKREAAQH